MAQPITSTGYDGTVDEQDWAGLSAASASRPGIVEGFGASIVGNVDRTVRVSPGKAYGWGVLDTLTGNVDLQADPVTSGSGWDTLVLRRDWQPTPGGGSTLMLLKGTSAKKLAAGLVYNPGVLADQILGAVRVEAGLTTIQEYENYNEWQASLSFRFWTTVPDPVRYNYGDKLLLNPNPGWGLDIGVRRGDTGTENWDMLLCREWKTLNLASGYRAFSGRTPQVRIVGDMLQLRGQLERTNGATFNNAYTTVASVPAASAPKVWTPVPVASTFWSDTGGGGLCSIASDGVIQMAYPAGKASWGSFDGISIPIG